MELQIFVKSFLRDGDFFLRFTPHHKHVNYKGAFVNVTRLHNPVRSQKINRIFIERLIYSNFYSFFGNKVLRVIFQWLIYENLAGNKIKLFDDFVSMRSLLFVLHYVIQHGIQLKYIRTNLIYFIKTIQWKEQILFCNKIEVKFPIKVYLTMINKISICCVSFLWQFSFFMAQHSQLSVFIVFILFWFCNLYSFAVLYSILWLSLTDKLDCG